MQLNYPDDCNCLFNNMKQDLYSCKVSSSVIYHHCELSATQARQTREEKSEARHTGFILLMFNSIMCMLGLQISFIKPICGKLRKVILFS